MKLKLTLLSVLFILTITVHCIPSFTWNVWPEPLHKKHGSEVLSISPHRFSFHCKGECPQVLKENFHAYLNHIFFTTQYRDPLPPSHISSYPEIEKLTFVIQKTNVPLDIGVDESYKLDIKSAKDCVISANTIWGALRGLETFSQLIEYDYIENEYYMPYAPVDIVDNPRFKYRGLLIDTSRHFIPKKALKRQIEAMQYNKMNVLHWHVSDDQSFPLEMEKFPNLAKDGKYSPWTVYSESDVKDLIKFAHDRGVLIIPEFDTPGHSSSWRGYPKLFPQTKECQSSPTFDVTDDYVYDFMHKFLGEIIFNLFDELSYIHLGGDEVTHHCWNSSSHIKTWMRNHGVDSFNELQSLYERSLANVVADEFQTFPIFWEEVFLRNSGSLNKDAVIHVWNHDQSLVNQTISAGFQTIYSKGYYLDQQIPNNTQTYYLWMDTWKDFYNNEPTTGFEYTKSQEKLLIGGEACMWGEQVDYTCIDTRIWPRTCAVAERVWSPKDVTNISNAEKRLILHRCRMNRRGINAGPIRPDFCYVPGIYE